MRSISDFDDPGEARKDRPWPSAAAGNNSPKKDRSDSLSPLELSITVTALAQFAFITLGIAALKILIHSVTSVRGSIQWFGVMSPWLFSIPVIWSVYATIVVRMNTAPRTRFVTQVIGIVLTALSFLFLLVIVFYLPAHF